MKLKQIQKIVDKISYKDWKVVVKGDRYKVYLQLEWEAPDNRTGVVEKQTSRKWMLSYHMCKSEIVQTVFFAVKTAEEHEIREIFKYKGALVFCPHFDVEERVKLERAGRLETRIDLRVAK